MDHMDIPPSDFFKSVNAWIGIFTPIAVFGLGISISIALLHFVGNAMANIFRGDIERGFNTPEKRKNDQLPEGESRKLKNDELPWLEEEKPKRQSHFELRDDGELFEVIDDK